MLLGDMRPYQVLGSENINMKMFDCSIMDLYDFKYVSNVKRILISLQTLDVNGYEIRINKRFIKVNRGVMTLMKKSMKDGLYVFNGHIAFRIE